MSNIICKKCGITAISKCPNCRHIFLDNQSAALLDNVLDISLSEPRLVVSLRVLKNSKTNQPMNLREMVQALAKSLNGLLDPTTDPWLKGLTLEQFCCEHKWAWQPGEQSEIGCGCKLS